MKINLPKNDPSNLRAGSFRGERPGFEPKQMKNSRGISGTMSRNFSEAGDRTQDLQQKLNRQGGSQYHWTNHVARKMMQYALSADRVKRVVRNPKRSEKGIAPDTIAVMQPGKAIAGKLGQPPTWKEEIWVMYATRKEKAKNQKVNLIGPKKVIITAWRYPGKSPIREAIPIPNDILEELKNIKY